MLNVRHIITVIIAAVVVMSLSASAQAAHWKKAPRAQISSNRMFELGVADPNNDGNQDIYTTNHKYPSSFSENTGHGFTEVSDEWGLIPDERFPGLEIPGPPANMSRDGVYVTYYDTPGSKESGGLEIDAVGVSVKGHLRTLGRNMSVRTAQGASAELSRDDDDRPMADFELQPGGKLVINASSLSDLPIQWNFDYPENSFNADQIYVGHHGVNPSSRDFDFKLRDRHSMAFADIAGDSNQDVFVDTGGLGGGISDPRYLGRVEDQLLISGAGSGGGYSDKLDGSGIHKGWCRGRQSSFSDYDYDGDLDLMTSCEEEYLQLYAQTSPAQFKQVAAPRVKADTYRWAQIENGGRQELLAASERGLEVWRYSGGHWERTQTIPAAAGAIQIALADYDESGSEDVMATVPGRGIVILRNKRGRLDLVSTGRLGLPTKRLSAASFVDYDNDGDIDVSTAPFGIYAQGRLGGFHRTGQMRLPDNNYTILQWMDYNNDGRRDPLVATQDREFANSSKIIRKKNATRGGRWLEVDLLGLAGNREAIGAKVQVSYAVREKSHRRKRSHRKPRKRIVHHTQTQWVGQNDDSRYSQGHYRVYFGLGKARRLKRVVITWADGSRKVMRNVKANQLLRISQS